MERTSLSAPGEFGGRTRGIPLSVRGEFYWPPMGILTWPLTSGIVDVLEPFIDAEVGRPRQLSLLGFLVACQLNALHRHHQAHLVEVARTLNALTDEQRSQSRYRRVGIRTESYPRVSPLFIKLCHVLESAKPASMPMVRQPVGPRRHPRGVPREPARWRSTGPTSRLGEPCTAKR